MVRKLNYSLKIKANPGTSQCRAKWRGDHLKVNLTAPPEQGKANEQLFAFLADLFNISTGNLEFKRGTTSEYKTILLKNLDRETLVRKLNELKE